MPPPNADLATTWAYLEEGVDHIMTKLQTGVSYSKYMSLYTVSYNYCTSSKMHGTGDQAGGMGHRSESLLVHWTPMFIDLTAAGANLMGSDLYNNLIRYFVNHLKTLRTVSLRSRHTRSNPLDPSAWLRYATFRHPTLSRTRRCCGIMPRSGTDTRLVQITSTDCSLTSTGIGLSGNATRAGRASIPYTLCVSLRFNLVAPRAYCGSFMLQFYIRARCLQNGLDSMLPSRSSSIGRRQR